MKDKVKTAIRQFCNAHGLLYADDGVSDWITIGHVSVHFDDLDVLKGDVMDEVALLEILNECKIEHEKIENIEWDSGKMFDTLKALDGDRGTPIRSAIADELGQVLDQPTLNKVLRVFYKYTRSGRGSRYGR